MHFEPPQLTDVRTGPAPVVRPGPAAPRDPPALPMDRDPTPLQRNPAKLAPPAPANVEGWENEGGRNLLP